MYKISKPRIELKETEKVESCLNMQLKTKLKGNKRKRFQFAVIYKNKNSRTKLKNKFLLT
jgi:hypothetical protein